MKINARAYIINIVCILLGGLLFGSCNNEVGTEPFELELQLAISANALPVQQNAPSAPSEESGAPMRVMGDPGDTETFDFPDHAYLYLVWSNGPTTQVVSQSVTLSEGNWVRGENELIYVSKGDPVYLYKQKLIFLLEGETRDWARLYVAVSKGDIAPYVKGSSPKETVPTTEEEVRNLVFDNNTSTIQSNLKNIYSTPYNYEVNDEYYGTIASFAYDPSSDTGPRVAYANLLLYHVAAKVDLMWNVAEDKRGDVKLSYIAVDSLYDGPCYLFKPTENTIGNNKVYPSGYTKVLLNEATPSPGTQWNGRKYFYAIPYKNNDSPTKHYPLKLTLCKDSDRPAGGSYYSKIVDTDIPEVWTSWIRGQISINTATYNVTTP